MTPIFEAKYIAIKWYDEHTVLKITEAVLPIKIEVESTSTCSIELQTYTRISDGLDGQIAFHIIDSGSSITPYFRDASGHNESLLKIIDPINHKEWWIEAGKWSKSNKYRGSSLWSHVGDAKIMFGDITCDINVRSNTFTRAQLDLYLNDFRNDFWYLILKQDSITQGGAKNKKVKLLNNETTELISKFIEYVDKVLDNPKKELQEVQRLKDIKKVKPVARTFMEIATTGFQRKMTSRDTVESYNVPENRYIHYILQRVYSIVFYMLRASGHMENIFENKYEFYKKKLENFSDIKTIDREAFENEIEFIRESIDEEKKKLKEAISKQTIELKYDLQNQIKNQSNISEIINNAIKAQSASEDNAIDRFIIKLESRQQDYGNRIQFWGKIKKYNAEEWDDFGPDNSFSLEFDKDIFSFLQSGQEYDITASNQYAQRETQRGVIHKIFFTFIKELKLLNAEESRVNSKLEYKTVTIKIHKRKKFDNLIQFGGKAQFPNGRWHIFANNDFYSFEFDSDIFNDVLQDYQIYKITAYVESREQPWENDRREGNIYKRHFKYIDDIEQLSKSNLQSSLETLESQRNSLESSSWKRPLTIHERQEQEREKQALEKSTNLIKEQQKNNLELLSALQPKLQKLKQLLNKCETLKIKRDSYFPNSITFVQNPNYQGSHSYYKRINEIVGVNEGIFIQLQLVEKIGLLDIPTIYERWCFLQIIKVLIDKYRFTPEENWKNKLANQTMGDLNKIRDVKIRFYNDDIKREIDLWYEKELPNKKRPDFILDIRSKFGTLHTHRLVMDAKFHEKIDIEGQIDLLYAKKNYAEKEDNTFHSIDTNSVFVLHPDTNKSLKKKRTPKSWGHDAYYGEVRMFNYEWDEGKSPNHKYGAILLSPITKEGNYLDNLQRLIGMSMQYSLEDNINIIIGELNSRTDKIDPIAKDKLFCLVCGSDKYEGKKSLTKNEKGYRYNFTCSECKHYYVYNYCWKCHHRLIKNGEYWSYHSAQILEPFNIKCPYCSELIKG